MNRLFQPLPTAPEESSSVHDEFPWTAVTLMQSRQTVLPKRLMAPGPDTRELDAILASAATAPDHGQLLPWRLILIPQSARAKLGAAFSAALIERDAFATPQEIAQASDKAARAPCLLLLTVDERCGDTEINLLERTVSAGCAVQNMLLMATALGFGSALTSGKALGSAPLRSLFGLNDGEHAVCFLSIGTASGKKRPRLRPATTDYVRTLLNAKT